VVTSIYNTKTGALKGLINTMSSKMFSTTFFKNLSFVHKTLAIKI